jgi:hypothetical protein
MYPIYIRARVKNKTGGWRALNGPYLGTRTSKGVSGPPFGTPVRRGGLDIGPSLAPVLGVVDLQSLGMDPYLEMLTFIHAMKFGACLVMSDSAHGVNDAHHVCYGVSWDAEGTQNHP